MNTDNLNKSMIHNFVKNVAMVQVQGFKLSDQFLTNVECWQFLKSAIA